MKILVSVLALMASASFASEKSKQAAVYKLILPTGFYPVSFDPLDADAANNSDMIRMRYLTPIEVDHEDHFKSSALESFSYDQKTKVMKWVVKDGLKFADGSAVTASDIVLSIKRMAFARPEFPVLSDIQGMDTWKGEKFPLEKEIPGLKVERKSITITFSNPVSNPFFQFTLELFAIQPAKCFDLKTSKPICAVPPASGYYDFIGKPDIGAKEGRKSFDAIEFSSRNGFEVVHNFKMPPRVRFEYSENNDLESLVQNMGDNAVVSSMDSRLDDQFINKFRDKVEIKRLPKTAIWYLLLNPTFEAFKSPNCRRVFANTYRDLYGERVKSVKVASKSFSSPIMPGYMKNDDFVEKYKDSPKACEEVFKKHPIKYKKIMPDSPNFFWDKLVVDTMTKLNMPLTGVYGDKEITDTSYFFDKDETAVTAEAVAFWPLDLPSGYKMFFLPKMHPQLKYVLKDGVLPDLANKIFVGDQTPSKSQDLYKKVNEHLYSEGLLNSLSYFGNVYISKSKSVNKIPFATSTPSPWQLFNVD